MCFNVQSFDSWKSLEERLREKKYKDNSRNLKRAAEVNEVSVRNKAYVLLKLPEDGLYLV